MYGRLALPEEDQVLFVYPFYVTFLLLPLVWLHSTAHTSNLADDAAAGDGNNRSVDYSSGNLENAFLAAGSNRALGGTVLQQRPHRHSGPVCCLIFSWLVLALLALKDGRDGWAGFFLALTTIKPQMTFLGDCCVGLVGSGAAALALFGRVWVYFGWIVCRLVSAAAFLAGFVCESGGVLSGLYVYRLAAVGDHGLLFPAIGQAGGAGVDCAGAGVHGVGMAAALAAF